MVLFPLKGLQGWRVNITTIPSPGTTEGIPKNLKIGIPFYLLSFQTEKPKSSKIQLIAQCPYCPTIKPESGVRVLTALALI